MIGGSTGDGRPLLYYRGGYGTLAAHEEEPIALWLNSLGVTAMVALIVIGPEKLPRMARTVGVLAGRDSAAMAGLDYAGSVRADVARFTLVVGIGPLARRDEVPPPGQPPAGSTMAARSAARP